MYILVILTYEYCTSKSTLILILVCLSYYLPLLKVLKYLVIPCSYEYVHISIINKIRVSDTVL